MPVPYLALADVFICAISVVFILLLLADPSRVLEQKPPQTDVILRCVEGGVARVGAGDGVADEPVSLAAMPGMLSGLGGTDQLSLRVLIQASVQQGGCVEKLLAAIADSNLGLSERLLQGDPGVYLLYDLELLDIDGALPEEAGGGTP